MKQLFIYDKQASIYNVLNLNILFYTYVIYPSIYTYAKATGLAPFKTKSEL